VKHHLEGGGDLRPKRRDGKAAQQAERLQAHRRLGRRVRVDGGGTALVPGVEGVE
jgi:hypothetical protein